MSFLFFNQEKSVKIFIVSLVMFSTAALATNKPPQKPSEPSVTSSSADQLQAQEQSARAKAQQEQEARAVAEGSTGIGSVSDVTSYNNKAFALSLPLSAVAAPAVITDCLHHSRGWSAALGVAARTGGTEYDAACVERVKCLQLADRLASWNQGALAVKQLQACGAVAGEYAAGQANTSAPAQEQDMSQYVKRDELAERDRRMVEKLTSK